MNVTASVSSWARRRVIRSSRGAGGRPEIGTPSRADCAIVCGESTPLRFGLDTFGGGGSVGRSAGGV